MLWSDLFFFCALGVQGNTWPLNRLKVEVDPLSKPNWVPMISPTSGGPRGIIVPISPTDPEYVRELAPLIPSDQPIAFVGNAPQFSPRVIQVPYAGRF
jgi:hypothetical protein